MDLFCFDFINSRWSMTHEPYADPLQDPVWVADFLRRWELPFDLTLTAWETKRLRELRALLAGALDMVCAGDEVSDEELEKINEYLRLSSFFYTLVKEEDGYRMNHQTVDHGWNWVLQSITMSFAGVLTDIGGGSGSVIIRNAAGFFWMRPRTNHAVGVAIPVPV